MRKAPRPAFRLVVAIALCAGGSARAEEQEATPDKSEFNLFHPTPAEYMRDMDTDYGGAESPYTVDAGHLQLETMVDWARGRDTADGVDGRFDEWSGSLTLRVGLLDRLDAQLVLEPYLVSGRERDPSSQEQSRRTRRGFCDITLGLKYNVWGNDEGSTALAVAPWVSFPTREDHFGSSGIEGGLSVPTEFELPADFDLGVTSGFGLARDEEGGDGYHPEFDNSIYLGHDLFGDVFGYVEFSSSVSAEPRSGWIGTVEVGWSWELTDNVQLNAGVDLGVTREADDLNPFIGIAWRF